MARLRPTIAWDSKLIPGSSQNAYPLSESPIISETLSSTSSIRSRSKGFPRWSTAPRRMASTAVDMSS